ncbi:hypothetical protein [Hydrogenispora ethanolica]|uniref:hypothetical protein n=1 Tax=Hydrogenispora ethanolica TaxID=1082276 RepID=UPI0010527D94|nr:hypothetical protein [Hydrogenispora ethanolica]
MANGITAVYGLKLHDCRLEPKTHPLLPGRQGPSPGLPSLPQGLQRIPRFRRGVGQGLREVEQ